MNVYRIDLDCDPYKSLSADRRGYESDDEYHAVWPLLEFLGKPKEPWVPPKMYPRDPMKPDPDFWMLLTTSTAFAVGPNALETVFPFLEMAGQVLSLPIKGKKLAICNVLQVYDCIDPDRSQWRILRSTNRRGALQSPYFVPEHIGVSTLFKIPEQLHTIYCCEVTRDPEDEFKACVEKHKFTGLKFEPVWSDEKEK